jgi:PAS domain S-box-containing protein
MLPSGEERFQVLFERSPVGMAFVALDGTVIAVNEAACRFWGRTEQELVASPGLEVVHPDERGEAADRLRQLVEGALEEVRLERRFIRPDGAVIWAESVTQAVRAPDGTPLYLQSFLVDTTDRRHAEAMFRSLLEAAPDATVCVDDHGVIALVNAQAERLFGYARDEMIGRPVEMVVPDGARDMHPVHRRGYFADPVPRPMGAGRELAARRKDGSEFPAEISLSAIQTEDGTLVSATIRDGTERRHAAIVASSSDAIIGRSLDGTITSWNRGAERMYGYAPAEAIGSDLEILVPPGRTSELPDVAERVRRGEPTGQFESQRVRKDGTTIDVSVTISPIHDAAGLVVGTSAVARDITDRKRTEADRQALGERLRQSERLESLGQLAGGVAHDFNNLLGVILNYAAFVAEQTSDNPAVNADVEQIRAAAERGARLTSQLLIVGRREAIRPAVLDLNAIVADMRDLLSRSIGEQVKLTVRSAIGLPAIRADRGQIEQILLNLAVNARDAMPAGGNLHIATQVADLDEDYLRQHPDARLGCHVELAVSDTGAGIPPEVVGHIFEPFFTTKPKGQGTGLGLATVYGIVTEAGGSLSVNSEAGLGTTFRLLFPTVDEPAAPVAIPAAADIEGDGETILVVEDEVAMMEVTARILRHHGYTVVEATTGHEAIALAAQPDVQLLLTDSVMPQMSGRELARQIREKRPELPVLFMSGYDQKVIGTRRGLGEDIALVQKPFNAETLLTRVRSVMPRASV